MTWTITSNQKKAFLIVWTHVRETHASSVEPVKQKQGQTQVCDLKGFAQGFFPVLQPWIQHFHFISFWSQIQLNLTIYLPHRHMCRQIGTTDSHNMQHQRKTTSCQRTGSCWNSFSHVGSDYHWSTRCGYLWLLTSDRSSVLVPYLPEHSKARTGWRSMEAASLVFSQML